MLVDDTADDLTGYTDVTGHQIDQAAVDFFRLTWDLKDLAEYLNVLRSPHRDSEDTLAAYNGVTTSATHAARIGRLRYGDSFSP